jgi:hypothetical protein
MSDLALRRRIAALMVMAFLSVMGATVTAATVADSADALRNEYPQEGGVRGYYGQP